MGTKLMVGSVWPVVSNLPRYAHTQAYLTTNSCLFNGRILAVPSFPCLTRGISKVIFDVSGILPGSCVTGLFINLLRIGYTSTYLGWLR